MPILLFVLLSFGLPGLTPARTLSREEMILRGSRSFSYKSWSENYRVSLDLKSLFPENLTLAPEVNRTLLAKDWQTAGPRFEKLRDRIEREDSVVRGEIENPKVGEALEGTLKLSLLRLRLCPPDQLNTWLRTEGSYWQKLLVSLAYDEASRLGLDLSSDLRLLFWKEMAHKIRVLTSTKSVPFPASGVSEFLAGAQPGWPIDRIYLAEARLQLSKPAQVVAGAIASEIQKNSNRTLEDVRKSIRGGHLPGLLALDTLWSHSALQKRRHETDLINEGLLRVLIFQYEQSHGKSLLSLEALVTEGFLSEVPLRQVSQKRWTLQDL